MASLVLRVEAWPLLASPGLLVATVRSRIVHPTATEARIWVAGDGGSGRTLPSDIIFPEQPNFQLVQLSGE